MTTPHMDVARRSCISLGSAPGSTLLISAFPAMGTGVGVGAGLGLGLASAVKLTQLPGSLNTSHTTPVAFGSTRPCRDPYMGFTQRAPGIQEVVGVASPNLTAFVMAVSCDMTSQDRAFDLADGL